MNKLYAATAAVGILLSFENVRAASTAPNNDEVTVPNLNLVLEPEELAPQVGIVTNLGKAQYDAPLKNPKPTQNRVLKKEFHQGAYLQEGSDVLIDPDNEQLVTDEPIVEVEPVEAQPEAPAKEGGLDL